MGLTFNLIRLGTFAAMIGLSAVTIALAAHFHHFTTSHENFQIKWDVVILTYALAVGAITAIVLLPAVIIDRVRRPSTPPVWFELLVTFILAMLWVAIGARIHGYGLHQISCSLLKQFNRDGFDLVSLCRQLKVFEIFGYVGCGVLMLYFVIVVIFGIWAQRRGDSPWTKRVHELQEAKQW